jgi:type VI secretion system lysozyme-like protein
MDIFRLAHCEGHHKPERRSGSDVPTMDLATHLNPSELQERLSADLDRLLSTINLNSDHARASKTGTKQYESVLPDFTSRSVLNYGMPDIYSLTTSETAIERLENWLAQALMAHEPRLEHLNLKAQSVETSPEGIVRFSISAVVGRDPYDVPIDMVAEVDLGSGSVRTREGLR